MTNLSKLLVPTILCSTLLVSTVSASDKCYALAFSSGQENAAYQAGALKGLLSKLPADQLRYNAVSGISGGAVNAAILGVHEKGDESTAASKMEQFWKDAGNTKLY